MIIKSAKFISSYPSVTKIPAHGKPEFAFIGRSNVGKSSLINMLTGRKSLAMTSATPGKTMLINHFMVNDEWYLVDLPGYGYAQRGKEARDKLKRMIDGYVTGSQALVNLFLLIDSRHKPQKIDLEFINFLGENGVPFSIVFTKADKLSRAAAQRNIDSFCNALMENWEELPPMFLTSSEKGTGRDEILDYIEQILQTK
ncbi:MAG: YihA family ribosome biogenesis GTP-binding protein [Muribaculaceae bacterium]|nr:YihA family ribosome biogenesis GTP-binding protein [Muribaculaceae bacterium]